MSEKRVIDLDLYDELMELNFTDRLGAGPGIARRDFLKMLGAGIIVLVTIPRESAAQRWGRQLPDDFNAFLRIGEDGQITGYTGKIEMGQGISTSLAQMLAEELDVAIDQVEIVMGDTSLCPWDMGTFGSMTTRIFGPAFRKAASEARAVLVELAAEKLGVPAERLHVQGGRVLDRESNQEISYGELARGKKIVHELKSSAAPEDPENFTIVGRPHHRLDARAKVTGQAQYAGDIEVAGKLHAAVLRPPAHGATLRKVDTSKAEKIEGVRLIREGDLIAALHPYPDIAQKAVADIVTEYEPAKDGLNDRNIFEHLLESSPPGETAAEGGNLEEGRNAASRKSELEYLNSYVAHAAIEPHTAVARIEGEQVTIWASTQTPFRLKEEVASELGVPAESVRVITPYVGGGFGGKSSNRQALEAARLARLSGKPVQVMWSREEEFFLDTFRPAAVVKISAGTDDEGRLQFWDYGVFGAGERGSQHFYEIPHHRTRVYGSGWRGASDTHPLATGAWRAPANNTNTFARESHIDMLAAGCGLDPVEFRLKNLSDRKMIKVLEAAADHYGWPARSASKERGVGVSLGIDAGTYVAHIAEIEVDPGSGRIRVTRVVCAQDMGLCINPEGARLQMEGCITMGLGYALAEEIRFDEGRILDTNFDTYQIPRFSWLPEMETLILDDPKAPPQGGGEPAIVGMGSVIANALFDATGARVLELPLTPERVKSAL